MCLSPARRAPSGKSCANMIGFTPAPCAAQKRRSGPIRSFTGKLMQKDASTVPADPFGKQLHVVEILNIVDVGTSMVLDSHVHANFHAQTALRGYRTDAADVWTPRSSDPGSGPALGGQSKPSANFLLPFYGSCCVWASPPWSARHIIPGKMASSSALIAMSNTSAC